MTDILDRNEWLSQHAPGVCDVHGATRMGHSRTRGFEGYDYLCGCGWGSDDGRGEGFSRGIGPDLREAPPVRRTDLEIVEIMRQLPVKQHERWRHRRTGATYFVLCVAFVRPSLSAVVVYTLDNSFVTPRWTRPVAEFIEKFDCVGEAPL